MRKIRICNDFTYIMDIIRNGEPVDLHNTQDRMLTVSCRGRYFFTPTFQIIYPSQILIKFKTQNLVNIGIHNLKFEYTIPYANKEGGRKYTTDEDAFMIVPFTADSDEARIYIQRK